MQTDSWRAASFIYFTEGTINTTMAKNKLTSPSLEKFMILMAIGFCLINSATCAAPPADLQGRVCKTAGCIKAASLVLENIDTTISPCDNFYEFACGKFTKEKVIPENKASASLFSQNTDRLQERLKESIEQKIEESDPKTFKLLQSYYNVCLDTEKIEKASTAEVLDMISSLGHWPVVVGESWNESNFDWKKLIYQLRKIGFGSTNSLVRFDIEIDEKNTTRHMIGLDQAATGVQQEYLSKGLTEKVVQAYYKYMVDLAEILGAERKQAEKELTESLKFEIGLAKISLATEERRNMSELYNLMTVEQLESKYPDIPWGEYLNELVSPRYHIQPTDEIIVRVPSFLGSLSKLISETPKRVLANYLVWRVVQESSYFMNEQVRNVKAEFRAAITGTNVQQPRWMQCIAYVSNNMPQAMGALYVRKNFDKHSKSDVEDLVKELRKSFENMLKKIDWMDEETKKAALLKLNSIRSYVAYPDEFLDNEKLDKHFEDLQANADSFLKSHLLLNLFHLGYNLDQLRKPVNKTDWVSHGISAIVNAFYAPTENSIQIPAGILQEEFFTSSRPNYMNYGAVGWIIGHEFTHGFDDQGSQFDKDGNLANWWDIRTQKEYLERAQCIIDQYSNYTVSQVGLKINGKNTQGENIADNGGIKEAYFAYESYERQNGQEARLPGLAYSPRQMFWISAANIWCNKFRPEALKNRVITDVHSPGEFRVIVPLSNMPEFARDFECPLGSPMNPVKKCTVW